MNCPRCGAGLAPGAPACTYCGTPLNAGYPPAPSPYAAPPPYAPPYPGAGYPPAGFGPAVAAPKTSTMAVIGFIFAFLCSLVGLILSIIALVRINKSNGMLRGKSFAIAGIILAAIFLVVSVVYQVMAAAR